MSAKITSLLLLMFIAFTVNAQSSKLFEYDGQYTASDKNDPVQRGTKLLLDKIALQNLYQQSSPTAIIQIPIAGKVLELQLKKSNFFSKNISFILSSTRKPIQYNPGYYLQGKIAGEENSFAAISLFETHAAGVISFGGQNYTLAIANKENDYNTSNYILYADADAKSMAIPCQTKDETSEDLKIIPSIQRNSLLLDCPVDIYFEAAYSIYTGQGNNAVNVLNYVTTLFNSVQLLYANEDVLIQIREVIVWNNPDPENAVTTTNAALSSFQSRLWGGFNGDLAHYLTYRSIGGGLAQLDVLCGGGFAVNAGMRAIYPAFPNYSFSINVVAHEMGHNIGSRHTQNCGWPGGAIDNCYATEGGCPPGPAPVNGGTVMSYCHLVAAGVNFANGFGPLPGDRIRSRVTAAATSSCNCDCDNLKVDITTQDIGCGSPTGTATAVITDGLGPFTYEWSNGATTASVTGLSAGTYYVKVKGAGLNCKVIKGFVINNTGNALQVNLSPSSTTVERCINENYTITATIVPSGTYNYQWYRNAVAIAGATTDTYTASTTGAYYLSIDNGTCVGQSATVNVNFQNLSTPVINSSGSTTICAGESITLSIPSTTYSIEWSRNGAIIAGANSDAYTTTLAGNYSVRVFSPGNAACNATSLPVSIIVNAVPQSVVTPAGPLSFCDGGSAIISHNSVLAGETYNWFRNGLPIPGANSNDITVTTSGDYSLEVTAVNGCSKLSNIVNVVANPLPSQALNPAGTVTLCDGGTLRINAENNPAFQYQWFDNGQPISAANTATLTVTSSGNFSVQIENTVTGCSSSSAITYVTIIAPPRIFAGHDTILATGQQYSLNVVELSNLGIDHYEWTPSTGLNNPLIQNPTATLYNSQEYVVTGVHPSGCKTTDTILLKVLQGPAFYVPNAFSPNGDGLNDRLSFYAVGLRSFLYFEVYNRLGQKVFRTTNAGQRWDGKWNGTEMANGTYVWIAMATDYRGQPLQSKGTVVLIR
jgi:gliding motility-associated-like protein